MCVPFESGSVGRYKDIRWQLAVFNSIAITAACSIDALMLT